jgi:hypothetical protein
LNFEEILRISKLQIIPEIILNKAFILADIIYTYNYTYTLTINKDNKLEFLIKNKKKKLKMTILDRSWVYSNKDTFLFNRGTIKKILDELGEDDESPVE